MVVQPGGKFCLVLAVHASLLSVLAVATHAATVKGTGAACPAQFCVQMPIATASVQIHPTAHLTCAVCSLCWRPQSGGGGGCTSCAGQALAKD